MINGSPIGDKPQDYWDWVNRISPNERFIQIEEFNVVE
jgi:hypothetical protein